MPYRQNGDIKMKIAIKPQNLSKISAELMLANGKAISHTYSTYNDIEGVINDAELSLKRTMLPKTYQVGAIFTSVSGDTTANAYKYARQATSVKICKGSGGIWFLIEVSATSIYQAGGKNELVLTEAQDEKCIEQLRKKYRVSASKP